MSKMAELAAEPKTLSPILASLDRFIDSVHKLNAEMKGLEQDVKLYPLPR